MRTNNWKVLGSVSLAAAVIALSGCSSIMGNRDDGRTANQQMNDSRIASQVKADLASEPIYKFNTVDVKTFGGVVQLSGFVDSEQQKARAGQIAQSVPGVARVDNSITIKAENLTPTGRPLTQPNPPVINTNLVR